MKKLSPLIKTFLESPTEVLKGTHDILERTFKHSKIQNIGLSLNGGKDSTVILFLALYFLEQFGKKEQALWQT